MVKHTSAFEKALAAVIKIDPSLKPVVEAKPFPDFLASAQRPTCSFEYLVRSIASQQVSGASAKAILDRFIDKFGNNRFPQPNDITDVPIETLRLVGFSQRKAEYIQGLAEAYARGDLSDKILQSESDDEVVDRLTAIRGLGPWTSQMFLVFYLHRLDVFSPGDIGVQRGFRQYEKAHFKHNVDITTELPLPPGTSRSSLAKYSLPPDIKHMEHVAHKFSPYRSAFMLILWRLSDTQLEIGTKKTPSKVTKSTRPTKVAKAAKDAVVKVAKATNGTTAIKDTQAVKEAAIATVTKETKATKAKRPNKNRTKQTDKNSSSPLAAAGTGLK